MRGGNARSSSSSGEPAHAESRQKLLYAHHTDSLLRSLDGIAVKVTASECEQVAAESILDEPTAVA
ncbi:hypothetical protein T261_8443 [Streptomyces lydicus]|nr:hypothetical protein T261_8443 [Streptomyces lydicus]